MKTANSMKSKRILLGAVTLAVSSALSAAPGTLSNSPLFLSSKTQPNILFMVDDSGSMDWADLLNAGTYDPGGSILSNSLQYNPPGPYSAAWNRRLARLFCRGFNVMAYDPNTYYTPWLGEDNAQIPFQNMTLAAARNDPYFTGTHNLTGHYYWPWNDADGDGAYDGPTDPAQWGGDPASATDECGDVSTLAGGVAVNTLPPTGTPASPNSQQNYANWYSYYRKREYVAKRALSEIITNSTARMGLATLHDNNGVRTLIKDVDDVTTPINTTAQANKVTLLDNLMRINSSGGTPLRRSLEDAGEYYANGNGWGSSPILSAAQGGECQQNFTVLMSDGFWNGGDPNAGDADSDANTAFDGGSYADGDTGNTISNTLADVAMKYYEGDLAPTLSDSLTVSAIDPNPAQHMVTYTVAFGLDGTLSANPLPTDTIYNWPTPAANALTTVDDMRHAAWNGRGEFLSARDPQQLITTLNAAIDNIQDRTGTAAAVSFNSTSLQTTTKLLTASFNSDRWSGELTAFNLISNPTTKQLSLGPVAWRASTDLDSRNPATRNIITFDGSGGIPFTWNSLTNSQKDDLRTNSGGTLDSDATGMARLEYIKGDHGCEISSGAGMACSFTDSGSNVFSSKSFRDRASRLGDIIHSSPTFVDVPNTRYPNSIETVPYSSFVTANASRPGMTYVGSNDGMLHGFDDSGVEVFSYIPNLVYSTANGAGLHHLTEAGYAHNYYVDLSASVADVFVDIGSGNQWRTLLIGGLRGGGKGIFAIDITDPAALSSPAGAASKVLWEFTDANLGFTYSDIRVGKLNNGKWAAIFGNGYNTDPLGDGESKIFIVYLDGSNLNSPIILDTGAGAMNNSNCSDAASDCNGMATPSILDLNGDGTIDRIYAGDLHGKMWAFDVSNTNPLMWKSAYGASPNFTPLFTACSSAPCSAANRQPITSKPSVTRHPTQRGILTAPNLMVFFGTGQYLVSNDKTSSAQQHFYGIWDSGTPNLNESSLIEQTMQINTTPAGITVRTIDDNPIDYATDKGWKITLENPNTAPSERSVTNAFAFGSVVFFNTMIPSSAICDDGGDGWLMAVDLFNGGVPDFQPIDVNGDGNFDVNDKVGGSVTTVGTKMSGIPTESRFISNKRVTANSDGSIAFENIQHSSPFAPRRMSWTGLER